MRRSRARRKSRYYAEYAAQTQDLPSRDCQAERGPEIRLRDDGQVPRVRQDLPWGFIMWSWIILIVSGMFEAVWATALGKAEGFTKLWPSVTFFVALVISMGGLAIALREIPTGTGYAVWVAVGASLTVIYGMATGAESASILKILLLLGIVACVIGLKLVSDYEAAAIS